MTLVAGQVAVVTGASRGIGKGIALALAREGARVFVSARTTRKGGGPAGDDGQPLPGSLEETVAEIRALGAQADAIACDLTDHRQIQSLVDDVITSAGRIDILVANAVALAPLDGVAWSLPVSAYDDVMAVGPRSAYLLARAAAPHMMRQRKGLMVAVSAAVAAEGEGYSTAFGVACAATDRIVQGLAEELREAGVAAISLWPRYVSTERVLLAARGQGSGFTLSDNFDPSRDADTPELQGRAIAHLAADPDLMGWSGKVQIVADLAARYGFKDVDGRVPVNGPRVAKLRAERGSIAPLAYD